MTRTSTRSLLMQVRPQGVTWAEPQRLKRAGKLQLDGIVDVIDFPPVEAPQQALAKPRLTAGGTDRGEHVFHGPATDLHRPQPYDLLDNAPTICDHETTLAQEIAL